MDEVISTIEPDAEFDHTAVMKNVDAYYTDPGRVLTLSFYYHMFTQKTVEIISRMKNVSKSAKRLLPRMDNSLGWFRSVQLVDRTRDPCPAIT